MYELSPNEDIQKLVDQLHRLSDEHRSALIETARDFKEDQEYLRDFTDIDVAAVIWHVLDQSNNISADEWSFKVVSYFVDQSLKRLLSQRRIVMRKDRDGQERFFAVESQ
jgi:hypothetical protein